MNTDEFLEVYSKVTGTKFNDIHQFSHGMVLSKFNSLKPKCIFLYIILL
jgi:hypothetical protein